MKFNHATFFNEYKKAFNTKLTQGQVDGLESILNSIEQDPDITDVRWAAYMMATVKHECADKWQPIEEYGKGRGRRYGNPVAVKGSDGKQYTNVYYGRGYVQLTWDYNYKSLSTAIGLNDSLYINPALALMQRRVWIGAAFTVPLVILDMGAHFPGLNLRSPSSTTFSACRSPPVFSTRPSGYFSIQWSPPPR